MTPNGEDKGGRSRLTIGLPTYNRAKYLPEAIDSVLGQTFADFTLVISDNASTDETPEIVRSYEDSRIVYRRNSANRGWLANFNASLEGARTDYAMTLCDDDLLLPGALARAVETLDAHPDVALYHSAFDYIDGTGEVIIAGMDYVGRLPVDTIESGDQFISKSIHAGCRVCPPTAVFRVAASPSPPYDAAAGFAIDYLLWLQLALGSNVYFCASPGAAFRLHDNTISSGWSDVVQGFYRPRPQAVWQLWRVKQRFLRDSASRLANQRELSRDARRSCLRSFRDEVVRPRIPQPVKRAVKAVYR